jgi:hypothetical protein
LIGKVDEGWQKDMMVDTELERETLVNVGDELRRKPKWITLVRSWLLQPPDSAIQALVESVVRAFDGDQIW